MSQKEFAARMDMSEKHISKLINGKVRLTVDTAGRLELVLGVPAQFWNNLESRYREMEAKANEENKMDADAEIAERFPYSEMSKYNWVEKTNDINEKVTNLRKYFEVVTLQLLENKLITKLTCRRLAITEKSDLALMALAQKAKLESRSVETAPISIDGLIKLIPEIRNLTMRRPEEFSPQLKEDLRKCGIAFILLPHLKGSFLQGMTFQDGNKLILGLTPSSKDADGFWFGLFHELAHIILGHYSNINGITQDDENEAAVTANNIIFKLDEFEIFKNNNNFSEQSVMEFAKEQGVSPGIVVGRLQFDGLVKYDKLNHLKDKFDIIL